MGSRRDDRPLLRPVRPDASPRLRRHGRAADSAEARGRGDHPRLAENLPDGEHLLFTVRGFPRNPASPSSSLGTGEWRELAAGGGAARYLPTGHLLYPRAGGLTAVGFDLDRLETVGQPFPILEDVYAGPGLKGVGQGAFSVSDTGVLAYVPGGAAAAETRLVWVDREGRSTPLAADPSSYEWPRLYPGRHAGWR